MTTVSIMGPSIFSWAGFFAMIHSSDIFVLYDDQPYTRNDLSNRNKIFLSKNSVGYITVPYKHAGIYDTSYNHLFLQTNGFKYSKILKTLDHVYSKYPGYATLLSLFEFLPFSSPRVSLIDFQLSIFSFMRSFIDLPDIVLSSSLPYQEFSSNDRVDRILKHFSADRYLSAFSSFSYNSTYNHSCEVIYQYFTYKPYKQPSSSFVPNLSFLDVLACVGPSEFKHYCTSCQALLSLAERSEIS